MTTGVEELDTSISGLNRSVVGRLNDKRQAAERQCVRRLNDERQGAERPASVIYNRQLVSALTGQVCTAACRSLTGDPPQTCRLARDS
jgi:hypothetical protein